MGDRGKLLGLCAAVLAGALLVAPSQASAWEVNNHGRREVRVVRTSHRNVHNKHRGAAYAHRPRRTHDKVAVILPSMFFRIVIGNARPAAHIYPAPVCGR